ncbi:acyl-CoA desaturase [Fuerstiella marisgermanici]|uniref:Fatty acid desaturase n=1 Tax=Fuerstiella marisgermanici TaxID=1891926 RepID=A0A1P8WSK7_9PLAN|nr:fatty acid desaturase [Fuerstiella marisgermanici]APZ97044.1 Fatty acid desaturase [Fuerstiella marisgermanici]
MTESLPYVAAPAAPLPNLRGEVIETPAATRPYRINWGRAVVVVTVHTLALAAFLPAMFSWTGLALVAIGHHLFGMLGVTLCYHRMLTHRSLQTPKWFERTLATLGVCCLQDTPARWVAIHRMHHQHSDKQDDPHSPAAGFVWGHLGWLLYQNGDHHTLTNCDRYAHDVLRDRYYFWLERGINGMLVYLIHAALFFAAGFAVGSTFFGGTAAGVQFGLSLLVWGVLVRTVVVWHGTWAVNSISHVFGYRNYETREDSRNNWLIAMFSHGEGWHNNHHAKPRCANNRHKWWEFDLTYQVIRGLRFAGLATNVVELEEDKPVVGGDSLLPS